MAVMLEALDVTDGVRVLEVGTGTGYNAALLCHRLGDQHVVTVEVDPVLAEQAQQRLAEVGYRPIVHVGDGADGYPPGAPYDRVIVTCALTSLPWKLIEQTRQGGVLVVPVWRGHLPAGLMLRLTATGGSLARGQVLDAYGGSCRPGTRHLRTPCNCSTATKQPRMKVARHEPPASPRAQAGNHGRGLLPLSCLTPSPWGPSTTTGLRATGCSPKTPGAISPLMGVSSKADGATYGMR